MKTNNPMFKAESRKKISDMQRGKNNSFFGKRHTVEFIETIRARWTGPGNPNFGGMPMSQRKKLSEIRKELYRTGKLKPSPQKKGKDSPLWRVPRSDSVRAAISRGNTGKTLSDSTKEKLRIARINQKNIGQSGISMSDLMLQAILEELGIKFQADVAGIVGRPDILIAEKIVIFADGDFIHANPQRYLHHGTMHHGYKANDHIIGRKYAALIWQYDQMITSKLQQQGFIVIRFWASDIEYQPEKVIEIVKTEIKKM